MEGYDESTYGRAFADVYDDWYGDDPRVDDLLTTVAALTHPAEGPLVELGAGTGRLTAPIAGRLPDCRVIAIDSSAEMLDRLQARGGCERVERVLGDMLDDLPDGPLSFVLASYNTVFNLVGEGRQLELLQRIAASLASGGHLAIETEPPVGDELDDDSTADSSVTVRHMTADTVVLAVSRHLSDRRLEGHFVEMTDGGRTRLRPWSIRWFDHFELAAMADAAGLEIAHHGADWPADADAFEPGPPADPHGRRVTILRRADSGIRA